MVSGPIFFQKMLLPLQFFINKIFNFFFMKKSTYKLWKGPDFSILPLEIFLKWTEKWTEKFIFKFVNWTMFIFKRVNFELNSVHFFARWTRTELSSHFWWTVTSLEFKSFFFNSVIKHKFCFVTSKPSLKKLIITSFKIYDSDGLTKWTSQGVFISQTYT